ncbi:MAG: hypothetical protein ACFFCS_00210 [Candidatus Hodarchaeota archaeon]
MDGKIFEIIGINGEGLLKGKDFVTSTSKNYSTTACWRGYIMSYEIIDNHLTLVKMELDVDDDVEILGQAPKKGENLRKMYENLEKIADFTGKILITRGDIEDQPFSPILPNQFGREKYIEFHVENGEIKSQSDITKMIETHREKLIARFKENHETLYDEYKKLFNKELGFQLLDFYLGEN